MRLSGAVCFEKSLSNKDSPFVPSDEEKAEGGVGIYNEERTSDEWEGGCIDNESYYEEEVGNNDEVTDSFGVGVGSE